MVVLNYFLVDCLIPWGECADDSMPFVLFIGITVSSITSLKPNKGWETKTLLRLISVDLANSCQILA